MIRFFKSSFPAQYIVIILVGLLMWGRSFFTPVPMPAPNGFVPFYEGLYSLVAGLPILSTILGFLLTVLSVLLLNRLLTQHDILQKNSSLAGFIFMMLLSFHPLLQTIQPGNISIFFLLIILNQMILSYGKEDPYDLVFSAGFFSAVGSFFYFPVIFFYGFILFSFMFIRAANWREWMASLLGVLTPLIFLAVYYFWFDALVFNWEHYWSALSMKISFNWNDHPLFIVLVVIIILFSIHAFFSGYRKNRERNIEIRRKALLQNWIMFFTVLSFPFAGESYIYLVQIIFIPFSGLISIYLLNAKKHNWQEIFIFLFILTTTLNNLFFRFY